MQFEPFAATGLCQCQPVAAAVAVGRSIQVGFLLLYGSHLMHRQQHAANVCTALELVQQLQHLHTRANGAAARKSSSHQNQ